MILTIFIVLVILCLVYILFIHDWNLEGKPFYFMFMVVLLSVAIGVELGIRDTKTYKKPLKPTKIKVECINGKCDTSYVYEFKD